VTTKIGNGPVHETEPHAESTTDARCVKSLMTAYTQSQDMSSPSAQLAEGEDIRYNPYHQQAQVYLACDMSALPLTPLQKKPAVCWTEYQTKRPKPEKLTEYWQKFPDSEVCFITGNVSGRIVVEIDPRHGGNESLAELEAELGILPATQTVITGRGDGGTHLHYACPKGKKIQSCDLAPGVEIKAEGKMCVLPPSRHPVTLQPYTWLAEHSLNAELTPLPEAWLKRLKSASKTQSKAKNREQVKQVLNTSYTSDSVTAMQLVNGSDLRQWFACLEAIPAVCEELGIPAVAADGLTVGRGGRKFRCILPGHGEDKDPSANLYVEDRCGTVVYHDWHGIDCLPDSKRKQEFYTLPEIRAALAYKKVKHLNPAEHKTWGLRLLVEAGLLKPPKVEAPKLPIGVKPSIKRVYEGFLLLLACKWIDTAGAPTPFTWDFTAAWCNITPRIGKEAMNELLRAGMIRQAGEQPLQSGRFGHNSIKLFLPGSGRRSHKLVSSDQAEGEV
jgi:hypothetical protein